MKTKAAVLFAINQPLHIVDLEIPKLKPGQVLVQIAFSGVCHTQLSEIQGFRGEDKYLPHCLGHEAGGIIIEMSQGVTGFRVGQPVILSWLKTKGIDVSSTEYTYQGNPVNAGGITTLSKYAVISENHLTLVPEKFPLNKAALMGCPIPTGFGAVHNTASAWKIKWIGGGSIAIFGIGGVGFCALLAAKIEKCNPIIAIDPNPKKLDIAEKFGATSVVRTIQEIPDMVGTLDYAIETSGSITAMRQALQVVKPRGGIAVVIGNAKQGEMLEIDPRWLNDGKQLRGSWGGDSDPQRDFPTYMEMIHQMDLNPLLENVYSLDNINPALEDLKQGNVLRPMIDMSI